MKAFLPESEQAKSPTEEEKKSSSKKSVPLIRSILRTFAFEIFCVCSFKIAGDLLSFVHPKLLGYVAVGAQMVLKGFVKGMKLSLS